MKVLGVDFFEGKVSEAVTASKRGGLVVAPSGPGLSKDLILSGSYRKALSKAELILPDSGLMCLWLKIFGKNKLKRLSGLEFLDKFLENMDRNASCFWIMPDEFQARENLRWLKEELDIEIEENSVYYAPLYDKNGCIKDEKLLSRIESISYDYVFIQLGGGTQERLGLYLYEELSYKPSILCTGAAIAFLSGQQVKIPKWADIFYLGWLFRCVSAPHIFVPRYFSALRLIYLLFKNREKSPV